MRTEDTARLRHRTRNREYMRKQRALDPAGVRAYQKKWRAENIEHAREYDRKWHYKNGARVRKLKRKRYAETQQTRRAYANAWRLAKREEINARNRAKYWQNPEKFRAKNRVWQERHRDHIHAYNIAYRDRKLKHVRAKRGIPVDAPSPHDGFCVLCGRQKRLVADHDHGTGKFRGMICIKCNTTIGWIEMPIVKQNLSRYLRGEMADVPCGEQTDLAGSGAA